MRQRVRIIYNPTSGKELFKKMLPDVLIKLDKAGFEASAYATEKSGDATVEAERALKENYDILIAAGGDGTLNEVVNGIAERPNRPKLGVIPMGTVNDFGRALHLPTDILKAIDTIIEGYTARVDIGKMNSRYFINLAAGGKLTEVSYETPSKLKSIVGPFAYYIKGFEMLPQMNAIDLRIEYDEEVFQGEALLFFLGLTNSMAGFEKLVPDAKLNDGYFTLLIVEKANLAELGHIMTLASRGEHVKHPKVVYKKAKSINISSFSELQLNVDGEYGGKLPANFLNLKQHIEIFIPNDTHNEELIHDNQDEEVIEDEEDSQDEEA
ncbi:diacylglycerol kinase (ATP) [Staphylococcus auricularis]|uniref:Diacylglycerol kinase n=1 Tax=Staphylococcus auricularis TaxID=29379 RepID=A0AAP8TT97_9STAP|nr:diacylglycerol kinase [Staphylococcus auricularis]MBM0867044.1 diacylglycerol kinase [Staphylococcus auricularis]MCG7342092.1 diacylglycerol kinase [Staphylococcus auricularis]MDC6327963.1 diacylglycerol kinase [Staphylococcus auricularis]MDN4532038.1 diacylglycerol kinase [Staphylococcus auricularis]PNZ67805.1 diacylglycerol kinase [Staphylococcus auricularis]